LTIKPINVAMSDFVVYQLKHGLEYLKCKNVEKASSYLFRIRIVYEID